jgi:KaiC/GvpD/RAD55 family RecA-like ATPase
MIAKTDDLSKGAAPLKTSPSQDNTKNGNRSQVFTPNIYLELEKKIIGSILLQPDSENGPSSISRCQELGLEPQHFSLLAHQTIYRAFLHLAKEEKRTDPYHTTVLLHSWNHPYGNSQLFVARFLEEFSFGTHNLDIWAKDLIEIAERRQSITPENETERQLRGFQAQARELLMDDKITHSERSLRLEALKEEYELTGQTFNNLVNPIKKEVNNLKLKLEIKALLQESDPVEKEFKIREIAESYRISQGSIKSLLTALKAQTETTKASCLSLSELFNAESTAINWLVPGLLPRGETTLLLAPPKCGKTLMSVDLAYCLATGEDYFLNSNEFKTSPGKVLLISVDESSQSTKAKLFNRGFRDDDQNIRVMLNWSINQTKALEEILEDFRPDLVIVDSLKRINHGSPISENSAEFADNIYTLKELFNRYGAAGILIHHSSKDKDQQGVYRSRGSSAITGAVWGVWQLDQMPKPDPDNPKKQITDPNDPRRRFYVYSRDDVGGSYVLEFDPENYSFAITLEGLDEKSQADKSLPEKIQKLLQLNKGSLKGPEIVDLLNKEEAGKYEKNSVYKALNRLVGKRVVGVKQCPENKRIKIYYLPDFKGRQDTTTEKVAQPCSTQNDFSTPPLPPMSTIGVNNAVSVDESGKKIHDTIHDAAPEKSMTQTSVTENSPKVSSDNATEVEDIDHYKESGLTPEEVAELEREALGDKDASKPEPKPKKKSKSKKDFKVGDRVKISTSGYGKIKSIDKSNNKYEVLMEPKVSWMDGKQVKTRNKLTVTLEQISNKSHKPMPKEREFSVGDWIITPDGRYGEIKNIDPSGTVSVLPECDVNKTPEKEIEIEFDDLM